MKGYQAALAGILVLMAASSAGAQNRTAEAARSATPPARRPFSSTGTDSQYSKEAYVIEKYTTSIRFENDGTQTRTVSARIRIQSAVGAQKFSHIGFAYDSAAAELQFRNVRVLKPDGSDRSAGPEAVEERPAAITRDAPAYGNYQEKSIALPELNPGDAIEYQIVTRVTHPQAPGQFWMQHTFLAAAIVLEENLEVDVPKSRPVNLNSPRRLYSTDTTSSPDRIVYRWRHANLSVRSDDQPTAGAAPQAAPADVGLTSFANWDGVSRWYAGLQLGREEPNSEIRSTAAQLTEHCGSEIEKIQALYGYISGHIRSVDLPFGAAGYQPHRAADVFANQYADSADKHILLASMLKAVGIDSQAALLAGSPGLDPRLPSPAQFTRILTVIPRAGAPLWMESSTEVAPFGFLPAVLRGKPALLISPEGLGKMIETPAEPPFLSTQRVEIEGRISNLGKLTARIRYQLRGDNEFVLRLAFHRTPPTQWKELAQTILALDGVHGEVVSVEPGDPTDTENPFGLEIDYSQPNYLDWSSRRARVALPLLTIGMPEAAGQAGASGGLKLGPPLTITAHLKLALPEGFTLRPPVAIALSRDYAEFKSSYHFEGQTLSADRSVDFRMRTLPASRRDDYAAFCRAVAADQSQTLLVENSSAANRAIFGASADELFEVGEAALAAGNIHSATPIFERLVEVEPRHRQAWNELGMSYMREGQFERAALAFQKQLGVDPSHPQAHNYLGMVLEQQGQYDPAALAFRQQIELNPLDTVAHAALGAIYLSQHADAQAVSELDKAAALSPDKAALQVSLGQAYADLGQNQKALAAFDKAVELSPTATIWNSVSLNLAEHRLELTKAERYAQAAISSALQSIPPINLAHLAPNQFSEESKLASYWDTLGWVYFQRGDFNAALPYVRAAWLLNQRGGAAGHLAQILEKQGQRDQAIHSYALALAAPDPDPDARARLTLLLGGNSKINELLEQARPALAAETAFAAGRLDRTAQAEFVMILSPALPGAAGSRARDLRFLGGSEELRGLGDHLRAIDFGPVFPDRSRTQIARRGTLSCSAATGECSVTLLPLTLLPLDVAPSAN